MESVGESKVNLSLDEHIVGIVVAHGYRLSGLSVCLACPSVWLVGLLGVSVCLVCLSV